MNPQLVTTKKSKQRRVAGVVVGSIPSDRSRVNDYRKPSTSRQRPLPVISPENRMTEAEFLEWLDEWDGFAWDIAYRYRRGRCYLDIDEVHHEVRAGFYEAYLRFDKSLGWQFQSLAGHWGRKYARDCVREAQNQGFRLPKNGGKECRPWLGRRALSADLELDEDGGCLTEILASREPSNAPSFPEDFWERIRRFLPDKRCFRILEMRFKDGASLDEVGRYFGVTRERVRQLESKALDRLINCPTLLDGIEGMMPTLLPSRS